MCELEAEARVFVRASPPPHHHSPTTSSAHAMMHTRHASHARAPASRHPRLAVTPPQRVRHRLRVATCCARQQQQQQQQPSSSTGSSSVLVQGLVSALTETLRLLGVGRQEYQAIAAQPSLAPPPAQDVASLMARLTRDFERLYFVTGVIDDGIYDAQCVFADPTVKFSGLDLWKRNLQLLVPFLIQPHIQLLSLERLEPQPDSGGAQQLQAEWTLRTTLKLPWRPFISILGRTVYTLNADANQIQEHVEYWDVSAVQALLQILTPGRSKQ